MNTKRTLHGPSRERGVAAVEFGLLLMPLALMIFGTMEFGRAIYTYNTLDKTVRDAARHLSQHGPGDPVIQAEATCLAVYGNTECDGTAIAPGLTSSNVELCDAVKCPSTHQSQPTGVGVVNLVSVTIHDYEFFSAVTYVIPDMDFNQITALLRAQL